MKNATTKQELVDSGIKFLKIVIMQFSVQKFSHISKTEKQYFSYIKVIFSLIFFSTDVRVAVVLDL